MRMYAIQITLWSLLLGFASGIAQPVPVFLLSTPFDSVVAVVEKTKTAKIQQVIGEDTLLTQTLLPAQKSRIEARYWFEPPVQENWLTESHAVFDTERQARLHYDDWVVWLLSENAEPVKFGETDTTRNVTAFIPHSETYINLARTEWPVYLNRCQLQLLERPDKRFEVVFILRKQLTVVTSANGR